MRSPARREDAWGIHLAKGDDTRGNLEDHNCVNYDFKDIKGKGRAVADKGKDDRCQGEESHAEIEEDVGALEDEDTSQRGEKMSRKMLN